MEGAHKMWALSFIFYIFPEGFFRMNENKEKVSVLKLCDDTSDTSEKESQAKDVNEEVTMLYICDGYDCYNSEKLSNCYRNGGLCSLTPHKEHALSQLVPDFPPTSFTPMQSGTIYVEELDRRGILKEMQKGKMLKLVESV